MRKFLAVLVLVAVAAPAFAQGEPDPVQAKIFAALEKLEARLNARMDKLEAKVDDALAMFAAARAEKDATDFASAGSAAQSPPARQLTTWAPGMAPASGAAQILMLPAGAGSDVCGPGGCGASGRSMTRVRGRR